MADNIHDDGAENQVKGAAKQVEGKVQRGLGDAEQAADRANKGKI